MAGRMACWHGPWRLGFSLDSIHATDVWMSAAAQACTVPAFICACVCVHAHTRLCICCTLIDPMQVMRGLQEQHAIRLAVQSILSVTKECFHHLFHQPANGGAVLAEFTSAWIDMTAMYIDNA